MEDNFMNHRDNEEEQIIIDVKAIIHPNNKKPEYERIFQRVERVSTSSTNAFLTKKAKEFAQEVVNSYLSESDIMENEVAIEYEWRTTELDSKPESNKI